MAAKLAARRRRGGRTAALVKSARPGPGERMGDLADRATRLSARLRGDGGSAESGDGGGDQSGDGWSEETTVQTAALSGRPPALPPPLHRPQQGALPPLRLAPLRALQRPPADGPGSRAGEEEEEESKRSEAVGRARDGPYSSRGAPEPYHSGSVHFAGGGALGAGGLSSSHRDGAGGAAAAPDVPLLSSSALTRAGRTLGAAASARGGAGSWSDDFDAPTVVGSDARRT